MMTKQPLIEFRDVSVTRGNTSILQQCSFSLFSGCDHLRSGALPFAREALKAAITPTVSTMATMGIVSLPEIVTPGVNKT